MWRIALRTALEVRGKVHEAPLNGSLNPALVEPERDPELAEALRTLPPRRRLIVFLHYFADLSYAEIAEACGISEGTVAATLAQAREQLGQALLEKEGVDGCASRFWPIRWTTLIGSMYADAPASRGVGVQFGVHWLRPSPPSLYS